MKKYVNGKLLDMTSEDINRRNARLNNRPNARSKTSDYEARIKELEVTVETLLNKLETPAESPENNQTEDETITEVVTPAESVEEVTAE